MRNLISAFRTSLALLCASAALSATTAQAQQHPAPAPTISLQNDALAGVKYDNRWEVYGGFAYAHFKAGPNLVQGANLGGFDAQATRWFTPRWGATGNVRGYYGTSGVVPNIYNIEGPFVSEHLFVAGPQLRGPHNAHGAFNLHLLAGGARGSFQRGLNDNGVSLPPGQFGFFNDSTVFASVAGGTIDLNRSPRLALRISPDYLLTRFGGQTQSNFAISVGLLYRFTKSGKKH